MLISCNFCIATPIMKLEMATCVIHNCELDEAISGLIQQSIWYVKLEMPTTKPLALHDNFKDTRHLSLT